MFQFLSRFRNDEAGAVTVDWVVLTAAIVALAIVAFATIGENADTLIGNAAGDVANSVPTTFTGS